MNKDKLKKLITYIFIIFMIIQPLLDIFWLYSDSVIAIFKFSPSTIFRMIIMSLLFITSFLWYKNKSKYLRLIVFSLIFMIYTIMHHYNSMIFNYEYGNFEYSTLKEFFYIIRMIMPLVMIFVTREKNITKKQFNIMIIATSLIFSIVMITTNLLEVAITSYNNGSGIIKASILDWFTPGIYEKIGYELIASKGIFHMANQVSSTLLLLLPINIYIYLTSKSNLNIITILFMTISMLMLGTRVASYGALAVIIVVVFMYLFFNRIINKEKINLLKITLLLLILIVTIAVFQYTPVANRTYINDSSVQVDSSIENSKTTKQLKKLINTKIPDDLEEQKILKNQKIEFIKSNYRTYGIDTEYIKKIYSYKEDPDFWLNEMTKPFNLRANHRQIKRDITVKTVKENNNVFDYIFGMSFSRLRNASVYMENDIYVHLYSIGIIGIILFILPYFMVLVYGLISMIKNNENFNFLNSVYSLCIALTFAAGIVSGNVFDEWIVTLFLGVICGMYLLNIKPVKKKKRVLFISSTGGHFNELTQLSPLFKKYDTYIVTEKTKSTKSLKNKYKNLYYLVYGTKEKIFTYIFKFTFNFFKSLIIYIKVKPDVIVTTGAHTAVSMCYIGKFFKSKVIFIESFANSDTKTLSGRLVYPIADTFIVQWDSMLKYYPKAILGGWIY